MSAILDPGALLAAKAMSTDKAFSAMPNAPMIPDPVPGTRQIHSVRRTIATVLESAADWVKPYEPKESSHRLASEA
ncbi:MAG: hypothetical protein QOI76_3737 [Frankiales bacterium]|jgi:hypothetical protein|nr:hypothetical protein [Frankiales bacterium]MDX6254384.1 hypothetical protein [Frankiales bacterium]